MTTIADVADKFLTACDAGLGWSICKDFCHTNATFSAQAEPLTEIRTLAAYCDWSKGLLEILPDGHYDLISFAIDEKRQSVVVFAIFHGTHTGKGGPVPPTGKSVRSDYVYAMNFEGLKIKHMTKIWHSGLAMQGLGWA